VFHASIAVDPQDRQGDVFISCFGSVIDPPDQFNAFVVRRKGGVWQDWEDATPGTDINYASIEVEPSTGSPHVVCQQSNHIVHTHRDPSLGWQPLETISDPGALSCEQPSMFFSGGSAFVVWVEVGSDGVSGIKYSIGQYGNWSTPAWVTSGYSDDYPSVTARSNGDVYVVWQDGRGRTPQIWGRLHTPGGGDGGGAEPVTLSQSGIELFPNPTKAGRVTFQYALPRAVPLRVTLLDVSGRAVRTQEVAATGRSGSFSIDASGLKTGVYILKFQSGTSSQTRKLVIQ
jgi:hypothetical protein